MKKIIEEFKKFITRGNVVDMAVGVIVGGAFTGIVNGLSNNILKPIINWILALVLGKDSLSDIHTILLPAYAEDGTLNLAESIYIDWGAFINAIINFFLVAIVLFTIVKIVNKVRENQREFSLILSKRRLTRADKKELRARGVKLVDFEAVDAYIAEKEQKAKEAAEKAAAEAEEKARLEREANPTTEDLLKAILKELQTK